MRWMKIVRAKWTWCITDDRNIHEWLIKSYEQSDAFIKQVKKICKSKRKSKCNKLDGSENNVSAPAAVSKQGNVLRKWLLSCVMKQDDMK